MTTVVWRKSKRSTQGTTGDCVELASFAGSIGVRDSRAPGAGHLALSAASFADLIARIKRDELSS
ncbi:MULTISPECIES: DUF397 domain-containing protein [Actinomadura]|uniref:DUF397 domain-containing protein n=1 Tax=Actinomadura yumaensis TaxID=111807 RepID=A0ABW2CXC5_9ACTN|nr:DUF397 domain-containing protein [Actinomadura sp. J1-007]MWK34219.1 DUF397 domain-containing protein [Actinomadura sp. J1-007]